MRGTVSFVEDRSLKRAQIQKRLPAENIISICGDKKPYRQQMRRRLEVMATPTELSPDSHLRGEPSREQGVEFETPSRPPRRVIRTRVVRAFTNTQGGESE